MESEKKEKKDNSGKMKWYVPVSLFVGVIVVYALFWKCTDCTIKDPNERGVFGDKFGAVNALFSGLAFAGLIMTLILQRKELSLQRDELEQTRGEFNDQNKTMKRQRFENTFFNLMTLHQNLTESLQYVCPDGDDYFESKGRDVFKKFYLDKNNFDDSRGVKGFLSNKEANDFLNYPDIYIFNHYFHSFDGIVRYIDETDLLDEEEKYQYAEMLRNTLSEAELLMLFYYYTANDGGWHKQKAENYAIFYELDPQRLAKEEHYCLFDAGAYDHILIKSSESKSKS